MISPGLHGWIMLLLGIALAYPPALAAEMYLWTDDRAVVHLTDLWTNVPESMRSRVEVRESSRAPERDSCQPSAISKRGSMGQ